MNQFKFRTWYKPHLDKGIVEMFEQVEIDCELYFVSSKDKDVKYKFYIPFIDDDWLIEQFTGLCDKNGVEICEGDIIKVEHLEDLDDDDYTFVGWIEMYHGMFIAGNEDEYFSLSSFVNSLITRIGNIHDKENNHE